MKYIFLNLKRFDIPVESGGVNSISPITTWGSHIVSSLDYELEKSKDRYQGFTFPIFFPEAHIIGAKNALKGSTGKTTGFLEIGCQGVHFEDTSPGGNFGAFTSLRTAHAAKELGCTWTIIGHSEERRNKAEIMALAGASPEHIFIAVHTLLNREIACALASGLKVVYCIGEKAQEVPERPRILAAQIEQGLSGIDSTDVVLAYEPLWAIGPGKTPPTADQIAETASFIKGISSAPLVYGGGLKKENAESIGGIPDLDGGLIALTRFTDSIGFYPDEYIEIVDRYAKNIPHQ